MTKKIGVVLSGCGVYDGTEIHEAVLTLLALHREGADVLITAPDKDQLHVINHLTGEVMAESRNVLVESARIARGTITPLDQVHATDIDAVIFPGGFGAAKNLSSFAIDGTGMTVDDEVARLVSEMREAHKPIGLICISPTIGARLIPGVTLTVGAACDASAAMESLGAQHEVTDVASITVDAEHKVVSTGAYMVGPWIADVAQGIDALVNKVIELA